MSSAEHHDLSKLKIRREDSSPSGPPKKIVSSILMYLGGGLFLVLGVLFFFRSAFESDITVETTTVSFVSPTQANALLTASGYVVAQRKAAVASKATGRLVFLGFEEGDIVKKGEVIGRIESADVEAALQQARADLNVQQAELNDAEQSLERAKKLFDGKLISQAEFDVAQARYDRVKASIASREAAVKGAEVQLENTYIRAPFDGTVLTKNADIGEVVAPFAAGASSRVAIVTIADMSSLEVEADVSESNIERVSAQQPCEISLDAYPEKRYRGIVGKIVPTADRAKATVLTKIKFLERDKRVLPEMSAKVNFLSDKAPAPSTDSPLKLTVDAAAVTERDGKKIAFLVKDKTVSETEITLGDPVGKLVEIKSGLSAGDKVVIRPSNELHTGSSIKLKE